MKRQVEFIDGPYRDRRVVIAQPRDGTERFPDLIEVPAPPDWWQGNVLVYKRIGFTARYMYATTKNSRDPTHAKGSVE